jgi:hypothetical protein
MLGVTVLTDDRNEIVEVNVWIIFLGQSLSQVDATWLILMLEGSSPAAS